MHRKGPTRDSKKERFWRGILREHRRSGLNIRDFCRKKGLTEPLFYAWRRELKRRDQSSINARTWTAKAARPLTARAARTKPSLPKRPSPIATTFLPVRLSAEMVSTPASPGVECLLPSGVILRMPPGMELAAVAALVRAWEQERC